LPSNLFFEQFLISTVAFLGILLVEILWFTEKQMREEVGRRQELVFIDSAL